MSAPSDGMSLSDEAFLSQLGQRLQRDVNCLSDPDRSTRRRALTKLQQVFFREAKVPEPVLRGFLGRHLAQRLVGMLSDPMEKCREMAGGLLLSFVEAVNDVPADTAALAKQVFAMTETRIGSVPLIEPAEEVRALLLRLCCAVLGRESAGAFGCEVGGEACGILSAALTDPFPEAKRACCSLLLRVAAVCPGELRSRLGKVLRPLIVNLGHQHSKTRQMTLQALGALLLCGSDDLDKVIKELVLPQLRNMLFDRTAAVRHELAGVLASLVEGGFSVGGVDDDDSVAAATAGAGAGVGGNATAYLEAFRSELVSLLMSLLADDAAVVCTEAGRRLEGLGESWSKTHEAEVEAKRESLGNPPGLPTTPGDEERTRTNIPLSGTPKPTTPPSPSPAARALCTSMLPRMMPAAIEEASHWTVRGRRRAVCLLCFLVRYAGEDVTPFLPQLLGSLGEASRDDDVEVRQAVDACAAAVGCAVGQLSAVTDALLPVLRGEVSGESTPQQLTKALAVLHPVLSAASAARPESLAPLVAPVSAALCGRAVLSADPSADDELWEAGLEACRAVVESGMGDELRRPQIRLDLLRALLWLLAGSEGRGEDAQAEVLDVASRLAQENACSGAQDLFSKHFTVLLAYVVGGEQEEQAGGSGGDKRVMGSEVLLEGGWDKGSRRRAGFESLLRSAPRAVGCHLDEVMPIFRALLHDATSDPEPRLSMLALLECVLNQEDVTEAALRPHAECLMKEMVVPNAVWRAGIVAATVRKVAVAVLYTALRGNKIGVEAVYSSAEQLLPILKTNLEDHEASTRQMSCLSLEMMFRMMPGALGDEPVRLIYPELLKRLDDSNDTVRKAVCGTIAAFFKATPPQNVRGTVLNYSVEQLLVHLDDEDEGMQEAVFAVVEVAATIDPDCVLKLALAARSSHRSPGYCDRLKALASRAR